MATLITITPRDAIPARFDAFRAELDEHNDRRERLVKASRDVTILSKRIIFFLHRLAASADLTASASASGPSVGEGAGVGSEAPDAAIEIEGETASASPSIPWRSASPSHAKPPPAPLSKSFASAGAQGLERLHGVTELFRHSKDDLKGAYFHRYQAAVSPGLQEYIEAYAFAHYLAYGTLASRGEVQGALVDEKGEMLFPLPLDEYLLGVSDLTGELMRLAITSIPRRGGRGVARSISDFVRDCKAGFDGFVPYVRGLGKKQDVTAQSLLKIEDAAYAIAVRTHEYGESEEMLEDIVARVVSDVQRRTDEEVIE